jgi:hypothetical protein
MKVLAFLRRLSSAERAASNGGDAETVRERRMAEVRALLAEIASPVRSDRDYRRAAECEPEGRHTDLCCA